MNAARQVRLAFSKDALWAQIKPQFIARSREYRDRLISGGQFPRAHTVVVGGRRDVAEEVVQPGQAIVYLAQQLGPAIAFALAYLARRAPRRSGEYAQSFLIAIERSGAGGRPIPMAAFNQAMVSADATAAYVFSPLPFSRKLDIQIAGGRSIRFSAPAGTYADAAKAVRQRFPRIDARRLYNVNFPGAQRTQAGRRIEYPALFLEVA